MSDIIKLNDGRSMRIKVYCPMPHHILKKHWRVPMWHTDGSYVVCVDKNYTRKFTDETLPIFIRMKLPFAKARSDHGEPSGYELVDTWAITDPELYICPEDMKDLENIAWQVAPSLYIIVLHETDLNSLRGERLTKDKHDTRSKSKTQSKENLGFIRLLSFLPSNWRLW